MAKNAPVALTSLRSSLGAPDSGAWLVDVDDPARSAMTDFNERNVVLVDPHMQIDAALEVMSHAGVRSAFVMDDSRTQVLGMITAYDIMGEKPMKHLHAVGGRKREEVLVKHVMQVIDVVVMLEEIDRVTVGAMLDVFERTKRTHLAVVEPGQGGKPQLRGIFSAAKLQRLTRASREIASRRDGAGRAPRHSHPVL